MTVNSRFTTAAMLLAATLSLPTAQAQGFEEATPTETEHDSIVVIDEGVEVELPPVAGSVDISKLELALVRIRITGMGGSGT